MYINSNVLSNPSKTKDPIPYCLIRLRMKKEEGEVEALEVVDESMDYHTPMVSGELNQYSRISCCKDSTHLGF